MIIQQSNAVHQTVRVVSKSKVLAIFQPHLFSRTRDFADDLKVYRPLMKSFYWIFILHVNYYGNKLTMVDG
jgi:UDP-N-acetylmuramate-alanine ligase